MGFSSIASSLNKLGLVPVAADASSKNDCDNVDNCTTGPEVKASALLSSNSISVHDEEDTVDKDYQAGVQKIQATLAVWGKKDLILAYVLIIFIYFIDAFQQTIFGTLTPYVTSSFQAHSLTATTSILSSLIGGLTKLPLAKVLDIWGRPQGFALAVLVMTVGIIMMAGCNNVQTYAAAQVFYWVGANGIDYSLSIFIADTSHLKNRGFMLALASSPYIITTWIGGPAASSILSGIGFRWGFGIFAIIQPIVCFPLWALFMWNYMKAKKAGLLPERTSGRTTIQSLKHYAVEFDLIGLLMFATGLALFLLAFSLYSYQADGWRSPLVICFFIFGGLLIIGFGLYEKFLAPKTFIPWELLTDRTVIGAYIFSASLFIEFYIWDSYFYSFLIVVQNQTVTEATYITNIYTIGACVWAVVVGVAIRYTGRFKWIALYFGTPITILGIALMIHFRQPNVNIGFIVMCQIFIALGGGACVICEQVAAMAAASQQHVAAVLACESMFTSIGGAIGSAVASAIWTGVFPAKLAEYLPADQQANLTEIYGDLTVQASYPVGSPARDAINRAYGDTQKLMLIGSTAVMAITLASVVMWRDIKVKDLKQVRGRVV